MPDCRPWKPWLKCSGPKSAAGKTIVSRNALKHGLRSREAEAVRSYLVSIKAALSRLQSAK